MFKKHLIKTLLVTSALVLSALPTPAQYSNHQWVRVTTDNDDNTYHVDKLVVGRGRYRRYWMAKLSSQSEGWEKMLYSIDCQTKQRRLRMKVYYDENDKITYSNTYGGDGELEKVTAQMPANLRVANLVCSMK